MISVLLNSDAADPNAKSAQDQTPLHLAARGKERAIIALVRDDRVMVDAKDADGRTALHVAAGDGHERVTQLLLETMKINPNVTDRSGLSPLHIAAFEGRAAVVSALLHDERLEIDTEDAVGCTALDFVKIARQELLERLKLDEQGCSFIGSYSSDTHIALLDGLTEVEELLRIMRKAVSLNISCRQFAELCAEQGLSAVDDRRRGCKQQ